MVHLEVAIHPRIGHSDGCPSRVSQLSTGEVKGGDIVSIMLKTALYTPEERLASPVGFVNISASWAGSGGIPWINIDNWHSFFESFVFDEGLEPSESPAVEVPILAFPMFGIRSDSSKLLHYNYVAFPERIHKRPADLVQGHIDVSPPSSTQPFQPPFSGGSAFALKGGAELSKMVPFCKDFSALGFEAIGSHKKVFHPNVHADRIAPFRLRNLLFNRNVKEEGFISVNKDCMGWSRALEKLSLVVSYVKRGFDSLLERRNGSIDSIGSVDKPEKPLIQIHGELRKLKKFISSLLVCFGYSISCPNGKICWKLKLLPRLSVNHVMKSYWIEDSSLKRCFRNVVARITKSLKCGNKLLRILFRRLKFADYGFREPHQKHICKFYYLSFKPQFLSTTEVGSFLEVVI